jgi:hypothetical protein
MLKNQMPKFEGALLAKKFLAGFLSILFVMGMLTNTRPASAKITDSPLKGEASELLVLSSYIVIS